MNISYSDLNSMDWEDVAEANAALDIHLEQQTKAAKPKGKPPTGRRR
ncbi:hypothetical protein [Paenibacillus caseinilyticus]|nr:hypothetical protein [Paenibacillus caseinilyticus]